MKTVTEMRRIEPGLHKVRVSIAVGKSHTFALYFNNSKNLESFSVKQLNEYHLDSISKPKILHVKLLLMCFSPSGC